MKQIIDSHARDQESERGYNGNENKGQPLPLLPLLPAAPVHILNISDVVSVCRVRMLCRNGDAGKLIKGSTADGNRICNDAPARIFAGVTPVTLNGRQRNARCFGYLRVGHAGAVPHGQHSFLQLFIIINHFFIS
nr:MAG TPA: hypothetical protein [Caudoviricetes sp.]